MRVIGMAKRCSLREAISGAVVVAALGSVSCHPATRISAPASHPATATAATANGLTVVSSETFPLTDGDVQRDIVRIRAGADSADLEGIVVRQTTGAKLPLALISHGSPRNIDDARTSRAASYTGRAIELARRGYVAVAFLRAGFGSSSGAITDRIGNCETADFGAIAEKTAVEKRAVIEVLARQPYVDGTRILDIGKSAGGFGSLALAASPPPGLVAIVSFAGGRGSRSTDTNCNEDALVDATARLGRTARLPALWVYAENDHYFPPPIAHRMFAAWTGAGAPGDFVMAPPFGDDGHDLFSDAGIPIWRPYLDEFLRKNHLPCWATPPDDSLPALALPSGFGPSAHEHLESYRRSKNFHKAFATGAHGHVTWRSGYDTAEAARAEALRACESKGRSCRAMFVDDAPAPESVR